MTKPWNAQSVRGFRKLGVLIWICVFALATPWSTPTYADPPPNVNPAEPDLDQFHAICDDVLRQADQPTGSSPLTQKLQYCKIVKSSMAASDSHELLWKVWASVSATCFGLCGWTPVGIPGAQYICTAASVGAAGAEGEVTSAFTSVLIDIAKAGASDIGKDVLEKIIQKKPTETTPAEATKTEATTPAEAAKTEATASDDAAKTEATASDDAAKTEATASDDAAKTEATASDDAAKTEATASDNAAKTETTTPTEAAKAEDTSKTKRDLGACLQAAKAGVQAYKDYNSMKTDEETAKQNLASAKKVSEESSATLQAESTHLEEETLSVKDPAQQTPKTPVANLTTQNTALDTPDSATTDCGSAAQNGNAGMVIQCASSAQADLPPFINDPRFPQAFQALAATDLGTFFKSAASPKSAIIGGINEVLNPDQENQLSNGLDLIAIHILSSNSTYTGRGAAHTSGDRGVGSTDQNLKDMMNQLLPKEKTRTPATFIFKDQPLTPEQQSQWNIFDIVHNRYEAVVLLK